MLAFWLAAEAVWVANAIMVTLATWGWSNVARRPAMTSARAFA